MTDPKDGGQDPTPAVAGGATYDAFLSHNSDDKPAVMELARRLRDAGLEPFLDAWHLVPGEPWQEALETAIDASRTCVVFVGPAGFGTWENEEMRAALSRRVANPEFRVIPAILPGAVLPDRGRLPRFLSRLTWVDFRPGLDDAAAFDRLVDGIRGLAPDSIDEAQLAETPVVCPFRGLEAFDEEHAEYFFGREALTQYLVEQLRTDRFLAVVGASGSGKSSVVRAGLVPHVRAGELPDSATWPVVVVRPGAHPMEALASRLAAVLMPASDVLAARQSVLAQLRENERGLHAVVQTSVGAQQAAWRVLLVVDQFEEVFTLCHDDTEREAFVDALLHASSVVGGQTVVVLTMRADFFGRCATLPVLAARLAEGDVLVPPMEEDELRRSMIQPAEKAGLQYEKGLVDTILEELGNEPGSLPLLEHTLLELFEGRRGRWLTIDRYHEIGGVRGAIAKRAEAVYANLTPEQQSAARRVLLRLTEPGEGTEDTRRRASVSELLPAGASPDAVEAVVNQLADARLLVTSESDTGDEIVDVAHEALIRGWPRLQGWISENPAGLRIHRRITETALEWEAAKRDPSYLFTGQRLDEAVRWASDNADDLNDAERDFLAASDAARVRGEVTRRRRMQLAVAGTAVAMVLITIAGLAAFVNWQEAAAKGQEAAAKGKEAADARTEIAGRLLASEGQRKAAEDPLLGLRLEVEGLALASDGSAAATALRTIVLDQLATARTNSLGRGIESVTVSADGRYAITATGEEGAIWRLADGKRVTSLPAGLCDVSIPNEDDAGIALLTYGPDCFSDSPSGYELRRLADGEVLHTADGSGQAGLDPVSRGWVKSYEEDAITVRSVHDGHPIANVASVAPLDGTDRALFEPTSGEWQLVGADTGHLIKDLGDFVERVPWSGPGVAFGLRDDERRCTLWQASSGSELARAPRCGRVAVSPDGAVVAFWTDKGVELLETASGRMLTTLGGHVTSVAFSPAPGAPTLVAGAADRTRLLRTRDGTVIEEFPGPLESRLAQEGETPGVRYSTDGRLVFVRLDTSANSSGGPPPDGFGYLRVADTGKNVAPVAPVSTEDPFSEPGLPIDVEFSPDQASELVLIRFTNNTAGLYRTSDLSWVDTKGDLLGVGFMGAPLGFAVVLHPYGAATILQSDGSMATDIPGKFPSETTFVTGSDPPLALVSFDETQPTADRHPLLLDAAGKVVIQFESTERSVIAPGGSWFVDGDKVWSRLPTPKHRLTLPRSTSDAQFGADGKRLVVTDAANGTAFLIDLSWLQEVTDTVPLLDDHKQSLIDFVCSGPAGTMVDPVALRNTMQDREPSACR